MMRAYAIPIVALAWSAAASDDVLLLTDIAGDSVPRATDFGADTPFNIEGLVDLLSLELAGWQPFDPAGDPYTGEVSDPETAVIFRTRITFNGLVNPPGTLGFSGQPFDPFKFGARPVFGFFDLDVDGDMDTGGELEGGAVRYLANVARFGALPQGPIKDRAVTQPGDADGSFTTSPQFERTGADFALVLCGCWQIELMEELAGDGDGVFESGERWILSGRFLERSQGYQDAASSFSSGPPSQGGGTAPGLYDPISQILFEHDPATDTTTATFVGALDMAGAAQLEGEPEQDWDFDTFNHTSIREGLEDLIFSATYLNPGGPEKVLIQGWKNDNAQDFLNVTTWGVTALVGTSYLAPDPQGALYVWSDTGFNELLGDYNMDDVVNELDEFVLLEQCTGGTTVIDGFAKAFSLFDVNYDGSIDSADCPGLDCPADFNGDGTLNVLDFAFFQTAFAGNDPLADLDGDGEFDIFDFIVFQALFIQGCN